MTPEESQLLQYMGFRYLQDVETLSIAVFFYGASFPSQMIEQFSSTT